MNTNFNVSVRLLLLLVPLWIVGCSQQEEPKPAQPSSDEPATSVPESTTPPDADATVTDTTAADPDSASAEPSEAATPADTTSSTVEPADDSGSEQAPATTEQQEAGGHETQLALAKKSGCLACHAVDNKVVGPAWRDVSKRYKDDPEAKSKLIAKVSKGGRGNWTEVVGAVAMPPYSPRVSDENIAQLVDFVLSLEK